jgi:hypothetical protein
MLKDDTTAIRYAQVITTGMPFTMLSNMIAMLTSHRRSIRSTARCKTTT